MLRKLIPLLLLLLSGATAPALAQSTTPAPSRPTDQPKMRLPVTLDTNEVKLRVDPKKPLPAKNLVPPAPRPRVKASPRY
jgi:hypothetical protein